MAMSFVHFSENCHNQLFNEREKKKQTFLPNVKILKTDIA